MSGTFGYELDPRLLKEEDKHVIRDQIEQFHKFDELIREGDYYRLDQPASNGLYTAWEFVSSDRSEALVSLVVTDVEANAAFPFVKLRGLEPEGIYHLEEMEQRFTGAALMYGGYALPQLPGDYPAVLLHFIRQ